MNYEVLHYIYPEYQKCPKLAVCTVTLRKELIKLLADPLLENEKVTGPIL